MWIVGLALVLLVLAAICLYPWLIPSKLIISQATTHITEPLDADGYVDYLEAANRRASAGVTPNNNAVVLILQTVGPAKIEAGLRDEFFRRLGVPQPINNGKFFVDFEESLQQSGKPPLEAIKMEFARATTKPCRQMARAERTQLAVGG